MNSTNNPSSSKNVVFNLKHIFGVSGRVTRSEYLIVGLVFTGFKYLVEMLVVLFVAGMFYSPIAFLLPSMQLKAPFAEALPGWIPVAYVIWSLPFAWVATTMSVRRANDGDYGQLLGLLVLVPVLNLLVMAFLSSAPSQRESKIDDKIAEQNIRIKEKSSTHFYGSAFVGTVVGGLFAVVVTAISVYSIKSYGGSLFLGMPIVSGAVAAFVYNQPVMRTFGASIGVGMMACVIGGLFLLLFAMEGVICLVMAAPLLLPLGALGGILGFAIARTILWQSKMMLGGTLIVAVPLMGIVENHLKSTEVYMVESSVLIDAPREAVWDNVVAFPEINSPPDWLFRFGVAMPVRARIEGTGVGAVRHCEFTTGSFVEPIRIWDAPNRLAFDVTKQPDPLVELTPYRHVHPPHLQGTFVSVKGEFELLKISGGKTKLIGRTWYKVDMGPRVYWRLWTDWIVHRIHNRVLNHIQDSTEAGN